MSGPIRTRPTLPRGGPVPADDRLRTADLQAGAERRADLGSGRLALRDRHQPAGGAAPEPVDVALDHPLGDGPAARGRLDQPGRRRRPDRLHRRGGRTSAARRRPQCPDSSKIGSFDIARRRWIGPLTGSLYIGEPTPGNQYRALHGRQRLRHQREDRRLGSARPDDRAADHLRQRPPAGAVRRVQPPRLRLRPRTDRDPDPAARSTRSTRSSSPGTACSPRSTRRPIVSITSGPGGGPCPGQVRPFSAQLVAGTSNPIAGRLQRLLPEARPRRRRPVPPRPQLHDAPRADRARCGGSTTARRTRSARPPRSSAAPRRSTRAAAARA